MIIAGAAVYSVVAPVRESALDSRVGSRVELEGTVVRDVDRREATLRLTVATPERVLVSTNPYLDVHYGDRVRVTGIIKKPEPFETDSGRTFDYPHYLRAQGIAHTISFADVVVLERNQGNGLVAALLGVKHALIRGIEVALPEPHAALAEGLLLGEKQSLGEKLTDAFRKAGVVHIIVLSGYNVALVINATLFIVLRLLPRAAGYATAALLVVGFAVMTGGAETTIRATVMALLMMVARVLHRPGAALRGLLIAASAMALVNPFLVLYDLSFQLSVLATLGLILFTDPVARRLPFVPKTWGLREVVATTIATQLTVLPLLILSVGAVSLVFIPANALVLLPTPFAMLFSFIAGLAALVSPSLGAFFGVFAYVILEYIIQVSVFFASLPFSSIAIPAAWSWSLLTLLAVIYFGIFWKLRHRLNS